MGPPGHMQLGWMLGKDRWDAGARFQSSRQNTQAFCRIEARCNNIVESIVIFLEEFKGVRYTLIHSAQVLARCTYTHRSKKLQGDIMLVQQFTAK